MLTYVCGPIDLAGNSGSLWRRKLAPFLRDQLGHRVYDATEEAPRSLNLEEQQKLVQWQTTDLERLRRAVRKMIAANLHVIEHRADYVICYWDDLAARSGAMAAELTAAHWKGIPVYLIADLPVEQIDPWVLGCSDQVFSSVDSLKGFLASRFAREKQTQLWKE